VLLTSYPGLFFRDQLESWPLLARPQAVHGVAEMSGRARWARPLRRRNSARAARTSMPCCRARQRSPLDPAMAVPAPSSARHRSHSRDSSSSTRSPALPPAVPLAWDAERLAVTDGSPQRRRSPVRADLCRPFCETPTHLGRAPEAPIVKSASCVRLPGQPGWGWTQRPPCRSKRKPRPAGMFAWFIWTACGVCFSAHQF
jgi:hypothetical protein